MKKLKRNLSIILILALILSVFPCTKKASATSPKLSSKKITMKVGETRTIKLLNSKKKAFWSIENEKIRIISETKKQIKFKAVNYGTTKVYAKVGKKEYSCKITIKKGKTPIPSIIITPVPKPTATAAPVVEPTIEPTTQPVQTVTPTPTPTVVPTIAPEPTVVPTATPTVAPTVVPVATSTPNLAVGTGSREKPLSAYNAYTTDIYNYSDYLGKFTIQLLDYKDGQEAYNYVHTGYEEPLKASQEYIYVKFKIDYISGKKEVSATDVVNHYSDFYNSKANYQLENESWTFGFEDVTDMVDVSLYPGGSAVCSKAIVIRSGNTPITYRLQTGYNEEEYEQTYTWFTTAKDGYTSSATPVATLKPTTVPVTTPKPTVAPVATPKPAVIFKQDGVEVLAEYTLPDSIGWYTMHFMVIKNTSNKTVDISTNSLAYSKSGKIISAANASFDALGAGCTSVMYEAFETSAQIDHYVEYKINLELQIRNTH